MKIDAIEVSYVKNRLVSPWRTAYGEDYDSYTLITRMHAGGYYGYSEAGPLQTPTYSPEYTLGAYTLMTNILAPLLVGKDIESAEQLNELLIAFKGNEFAKSALEIAWWILRARIEEKPLHQLLGGSGTEVEAGADFGIHADMNELLGKIQRAISAGYKRIKLKVAPGKDIEVLREVRNTFPKETFHIDCNSGYTLDDLALFKQIDKLGLAMIEQPLYHADVIDHAYLQSRLETPICLDESITSVYTTQKAIDLGSCRFINIKPGRVGGLHNAKLIHDMCQEAGIGNWVGGMLESTVANGVAIELATLGNMVYPSDIFPSGTFCEEEISLERIEHSSPGSFKVSDMPGIPYEPDWGKLKSKTILFKSIE